jgi:uncharacterized membrane protein
VISLGLEVCAALLTAIGGVDAFFKLIRNSLKNGFTKEVQRDVWLGFARWILLGLEFMMAADIVSTIVSPTWDAVGMLGAIVLIRTFLSYFLERDFEMQKNTEAKP